MVALAPQLVISKHGSRKVVGTKSVWVVMVALAVAPRLVASKQGNRKAVGTKCVQGQSQAHTWHNQVSQSSQMQPRAQVPFKHTHTWHNQANMSSQIQPRARVGSCKHTHMTTLTAALREPQGQQITQFPAAALRDQQPKQWWVKGIQLRL